MLEKLRQALERGMRTTMELGNGTAIVEAFGVLLDHFEAAVARETEERSESSIASSNGVGTWSGVKYIEAGAVLLSKLLEIDAGEQANAVALMVG